MGTLLSIVVIMSVGVAVFVGFGSAQHILVASQHTYYRTFRFADFWIDVKKAPMTSLQTIAQLPGIDTVQGRVVFDVILDLPDKIKPITGRLISTPPLNQHNLNDICLVRGSRFSDTRPEEVIISEAFAQTHHLDPGDKITLLLNGKKQAFTLVGTAISPEYVYMVRGPGDLIPDPKHFGVLYVKEHFAREVLDFEDACNQVIGRLTPSSQTNVDLLLDRMDRILAPYGVFDRIPRHRQASHRFLSDEIYGLGISAKIMPAIFLGVAAMVLNILMIRQVQRQRAIVGMLKAMGYTNRQVMCISSPSQDSSAWRVVSSAESLAFCSQA